MDSALTTITTEQNGAILNITLNRPDKANALSPTLLDELKSALDAAASNESIAVVILNSAGKAFCAGYDLSEDDWIMSQFPPDYENGVDVQKDREDIIELLRYWLGLWNFRKPIVAQVQGPCLSGGGELLAICDLVVASEDALFGHPAGRDLGIPPTVFLWPLLIGMRKTKEFLYTSKLFGAEEALQLGLINYVVPADQLEDKTRELAEDIARTPVNHLSILKEATNNWYENMGLATSSHQAADLDAIFHQSPTFRAFFDVVREQGMQAALAERRRRFG